METFLMLISLTDKTKISYSTKYPYEVVSPGSELGLYLVEIERNDVNTVFVYGKYMQRPVDPKLLARDCGSNGSGFSGRRYACRADRITFDHPLVREAQVYYRLARPEYLLTKNLDKYLYEDKKLDERGRPKYDLRVGKLGYHFESMKEVKEEETKKE